MKFPESARKFFQVAGATGGTLAASRMSPEQKKARALKGALARAKKYAEKKNENS